MNYIGSKYSLLEHLESMLDDYGVPTAGIALDLFAGTAAVAQFLKLRGHITYANDWQRYSYVTGVAFVELNAFPQFSTLISDPIWHERILSVEHPDRLFPMPVPTHSIYDRDSLDPDNPAARILLYLDRLPGTPGPFFETYCDTGGEGRKYFSRENGLRIQAIRDLIETWSRASLLSSSERSWLIACLLESADKVANTASVYGAYLKHVKKTARRRMQLTALRPVPSEYPEQLHRVFCEDAVDLLENLDASEMQLVYIDPPYNHRQYASNYHVLETMARWDLEDFDPRGVTGLRPPQAQRSDFCLKSAAYQAFHKLFERIHSKYVLFSYNNEGILSRRELEELFAEFCTDVEFRKINYDRFRADVDHENRIYDTDETQEYLILGHPVANDKHPSFMVELADSIQSSGT